MGPTELRDSQLLSTETQPPSMTWEENLKPMCSPSKLELCDEDKKKEIADLMAMSDDEINAKIAAEEKKLDDAEEEFKDEVQKYQSLMEEKDAKAAAVKAAGLGLMKSVLAFKAKAARMNCKFDFVLNLHGKEIYD